MDIIKNNNEEIQFIINYNDNKFIIHYAACDLYWTMINYNLNNEFVVTKDDHLFYSLLDNLFIKLIDLNLLNNDCFTWISEAYGLKKNNNQLTILKNNDSYIIKFYQNPNKMFQRKDVCAICFCLSGSNYQEIANYFSLMFHELNDKIKTSNKILKK